MCALGFCLVLGKWTGKFGVIDTSLRGWATTLPSRVAVAVNNVNAVAVSPGRRGGSCQVGYCPVFCFLQLPFTVVRLLELHRGSFLEFRSACASAVWSRKMPLAHNGTVLSLLDGPVGCDPGFFVLSGTRSV